MDFDVYILLDFKTLFGLDVFNFENIKRRYFEL